MDITTKTYRTKQGFVEGVQVKWGWFSVLMVTGGKGMLACGVFDLAALESFKAPAALVESSPDNPIGNLERFPNRKVVKVNAQAAAMGIREGMDVREAFELI